MKKNIKTKFQGYKFELIFFFTGTTAYHPKEFISYGSNMEHAFRNNQVEPATIDLLNARSNYPTAGLTYEFKESAVTVSCHMGGQPRPGIISVWSAKLL